MMNYGSEATCKNFQRQSLKLFAWQYFNSKLQANAVSSYESDLVELVTVSLALTLIYLSTLFEVKYCIFLRPNSVRKVLIFG